MSINRLGFKKWLRVVVFGFRFNVFFEKVIFVVVKIDEIGKRVQRRLSQEELTI